MATSRLMTQRGEVDKDVTVAVGAANVTKEIELTFDNAVTSREALFEALERFKHRLINYPFPIV